MADHIETFIAFGDNHGDIIHKPTADALVKHIKQGFMGKPFKHRIHLGDCFDAKSWRKGAGKADRESSLAEDKKAGMEFIWRTKPTVFLLGNHDDRILITEEERMGAESDYAAVFKTDLLAMLKKVGCKNVLPYNKKHGKWKLGPITFIHGAKSGQAAVRESAKEYNCECLIMGHLHRIHRENVNKENGCVGISAGCIGDIDLMEYAKNYSSVLTWGNGWVYGYWNKKTNNWRVFEAIPEDGVYHVVTGYHPLIQEIASKYRRTKPAKFLKQKQ